jgi:uncharacterized integral membrane protein
MANAFLKVKVWSKVILFGLILVYVTVFIVQNSENKATLWVWPGRDRPLETSVLKLVLVAFLLGVVGTLLVRTSFRTLRQIREVRDRSRSERMERDLMDMKTKAGMLRSRPTDTETATDPAPSSAPDTTGEGTNA